MCFHYGWLIVITLIRLHLTFSHFVFLSLIKTCPISLLRFLVKRKQNFSIAILDFSKRELKIKNNQDFQLTISNDVMKRYLTARWCVKVRLFNWIRFRLEIAKRLRRYRVECVLRSFKWPSTNALCILVTLTWHFDFPPCFWYFRRLILRMIKVIKKAQ